ncbi:MAG: sensor histidine kinase [Gammaproteobacteria bacterium]|nr:sensor histidine kinase [Gammaproteobacteria bacterium]NBT45134.1 sensor histidine kinase [Gammaproteobacteria bacterium]NBY23037.1 sensor histidine kinase [Gammaproteobacteria bacterium]
MRNALPAIISLLAICLCYGLQQWMQDSFRAGSHLALKHPFFPYAPMIIYLGYRYGLRIGLLAIATTLTMLIGLNPELIENWLVGGPLFVITCTLGLLLIERLKEANKIERQHHQAQTSFMAMLAHEIRSPLATLETAAYSLSLMAASESSADRMRNLSRGIEDISNIVDKLLEVDAVESLRINAISKCFPIKPLLTNIVESASSPERINLSCAIDKTIKNDPVLTRRILSNLVDNALKYGSTEAPVNLTVMPERFRGKVGVRFRCINQIGALGSPDPSQLFTKYYRSPEASCVSGAGVGLWLCKQFTEVMAGEIHCEVMDQTISFSVWIPDALG